MARLPSPGGDDNQWGDILNAYLAVSLSSTGTLNNNVVGTNQIQNNAVTNAQLDNTTQAALASASSKYTKPAGGIPSTDMASAVQTSLGKADSSLQSGQLGAANGIATLDNGSKLTSGQLPSSVASASSGTAPLTYAAGANAIINLPPFQPNIAYPANFAIVQGGSVYVRNTAGTSGASWTADTTNWTALGNATVVNGGSLGATPTLALTSPRVQYSGILTANCALTISGLTAGCSGTLQLQQDSAGTHSLTINGTSVSVPQAASAQFAIQFYSSDGSTLLLIPPAPNFTTARTYAVSGSIAVPSGGANYLPPFDEPVDGGVSKSLVKVLCSIRGGTSVTFAVTQNGTNVSGLNSLSATPTPASTVPSSSTSVSDGDVFAVVVSAVSGSPDGLKVTFVFETVQ